jgi:hypothetical protein
MQEKAKVVSIRDDVVSVMPLDIEACMGCTNNECKRNGNIFTVANRKNFDIMVGSEVRILAPVKNQLFQGLFAVGLPILFGAAVFALVSYLAPSAGEGASVGGALFALCLGMVFVYRTRKTSAKDLPEIVEVF